MGYLTPEQLEGVSAHQRQWGMSFGRAAIARGLCTEAQIVSALSRQTGIRGIDLEKEQQAPEVQGLLKLEGAQKYRAVCLRLTNHTLLVAMAAPAGLAEQDHIRTLTGKSRIEVVIASDLAIDRAIARFYGLPYEQTDMSTAANQRELAGYEGSSAVAADSGYRGSSPSQSGADIPGFEPTGAPYSGSAPSQSGYRGSSPSQTGVPVPGNPVAQKRHELFDAIGLSARAADMVQRMGKSNNLSVREVVARIVEQWAANMLKNSGGK